VDGVELVLVFVVADVAWGGVDDSLVVF